MALAAFCADDKSNASRTDKESNIDNESKTFYANDATIINSMKIRDYVKSLNPKNEIKELR